MARPNSGTTSRRSVEALPVTGRETLFWDRELSGFGVRVYPSGAKVYLVQTRSGGKSRRVTLGGHGVLSADQARRKAAQLIADIKAGNEPVYGPRPDSGPTIAEVAQRYMREHVSVRCKPTTARMCRHTLDRHLLPAVATLPLGAIGRERVASLHYSLHELGDILGCSAVRLMKAFDEKVDRFFTQSPQLDVHTMRLEHELHWIRCDATSV